MALEFEPQEDSRALRTSGERMVNQIRRELWRFFAIPTTAPSALVVELNSDPAVWRRAWMETEE